MSEETKDILTYQEIWDQFPDEWVILKDVKLDENHDKPLSGRVVSHCKSRDEAYKALESYRGQSLSFFYTGDIPEDMEAILHWL